MKPLLYFFMMMLWAGTAAAVDTGDASSSEPVAETVTETPEKVEASAKTEEAPARPEVAKCPAVISKFLMRQVTCYNLKEDKTATPSAERDKILEEGKKIDRCSDIDRDLENLQKKYPGSSTLLSDIGAYANKARLNESMADVWDEWEQRIQDCDRNYDSAEYQP